MTNPKPRVSYQGEEFIVKSRKTEIPDFSTMKRIDILVWLNRNTYRRGYSTATNPLRGLGDAIKVTAR